MTYKALSWSLAVLLLGLATCHADDECCKSLCTRWKEAVSKWRAETRSTTEKDAAVGTSDGPITLTVLGAVTDQPLPTLPPVPITGSVPVALPEGIVQAATYDYPVTEVQVEVIPFYPVSLFGRLCAHLGALCAEKLVSPSEPAPTLPPPYTLEPAQYPGYRGELVPVRSERLPPPISCGPWCPAMPGARMMAPPPPPPPPVASMALPYYTPGVYQPMQQLPPQMPMVVPVPLSPAPQPVSITLVDSEDGKMLHIETPGGVTLQCKKMVLTPKGDSPLTVSVSNDKLKVKSANFSGYVHKITQYQGQIQVELQPSSGQTGVVCSPQLSQ